MYMLTYKNPKLWNYGLTRVPDQRIECPEINCAPLLIKWMTDCDHDWRSTNSISPVLQAINVLMCLLFWIGCSHKTFVTTDDAWSKFYISCWHQYCLRSGSAIQSCCTTCWVCCVACSTVASSCIEAHNWNSCPHTLLTVLIYSTSHRTIPWYQEPCPTARGQRYIGTCVSTTHERV